MRWSRPCRRCAGEPTRYWCRQTAAASSWLVDTGEQRLLFAADSNNLTPELYRHLAPLIDRLDALFPGMECRGAPKSWLYGALLPRAPHRAHDQSRRLYGRDG